MDYGLETEIVYLERCPLDGGEATYLGMTCPPGKGFTDHFRCNTCEREILIQRVSPREEQAEAYKQKIDTELAYHRAQEKLERGLPSLQESVDLLSTAIADREGLKPGPGIMFEHRCDLPDIVGTITVMPRPDWQCGICERIWRCIPFPMGHGRWVEVRGPRPKT